jgi:hypothetical protein
MKYLIDHVLEGIVADRSKRLTEAQNEYDMANQKLAEVQEARAQAPANIAAGLRQLAERVHREDTSHRDAEIELKRLYNSAPSVYDVGRIRQEVHKLGTRANVLAHDDRTNNSALETFLRALKDGGETHVSQYGLKQAGFDVKVAPLIVARSVRKVSDG